MARPSPSRLQRQRGVTARRHHIRAAGKAQGSAEIPPCRAASGHPSGIVPDPRRRQRRAAYLRLPLGAVPDAEQVFPAVRTSPDVGNRFGAVPGSAEAMRFQHPPKPVKVAHQPARSRTSVVSSPESTTACFRP
jgi:hypothetical protein